MIAADGRFPFFNAKTPRRQDAKNSTGLNHQVTKITKVFI